MAPPFLTALLHKQDLGSVRVTNPSHPRYDQVFPVIKTRNISGNLKLVLYDLAIGSFAIEAAWTDYYPESGRVPCDTDQYISTEALIALCDMATIFFK